MKSGKDIDSIYREKFKDAQVPPPEEAWDNIVSRLPEKEEKKALLPFWHKIAGAAAVLGLLLTLSYPIFTSSPQTENEIVRSEHEGIRNDFQGTKDFFNEPFINASLLLRSLMEETEKMEQQREFLASKKSAGQGIFANIIEDPEEIIPPEPRNSLSEFLPLIAILDAPITEEEEVIADIDSALALLQEDGTENPVTEKRESTKRLSISTKIAPLYFDNFGGGSIIDRQFAHHESAGEVSLSYGINVAYRVAENVKIRSGVNKINLRYNTGDISFNDAVSSAAIEGSAEVMTLGSPVRGRLNQQLGFLEVPLEIEYAILDKKIGLNLIGGGSALILGENRVELRSPDFTTDLGEARNLNNLSFSTNIGMGMDYNFSPQFQFSLEPVLKLQLNTFKDVSGLNPYYFGIYTGFTYQF